MKNHILWIEDDSYVIKGLLSPLEDEGYSFDIATSAMDAYQKVLQNQDYTMYMVDLILPLSDGDEKVSPIVEAWDSEPHVGIGVAKWLACDMGIKSPILLLSVVENPISRYGLKKYGLRFCLSKGGLLPSILKKEVLHILNSK